MLFVCGNVVFPASPQNATNFRRTEGEIKNKIHSRVSPHKISNAISPHKSSKNPLTPHVTLNQVLYVLLLSFASFATGGSDTSDSSSSFVTLYRWGPYTPPTSVFNRLKEDTTPSQISNSSQFYNYKSSPLPSNKILVDVNSKHNSVDNFISNEFRNNQENFVSSNTKSKHHRYEPPSYRKSKIFHANPLGYSLLGNIKESNKSTNGRTGRILKQNDHKKTYYKKKSKQGSNQIVSVDGVKHTRNHTKDRGDKALNHGRKSTNGTASSRRPRRSVVDLYHMISCTTDCNPLSYKGYGCYCGFLGSGDVVDGIDRCCQEHDWCYEYSRTCSGLQWYMAPYKWSCDYGHPYCVPPKGHLFGARTCGFELCQCDRQFAECLKHQHCPHGKAVCRSSGWRGTQNRVMGFLSGSGTVHPPPRHHGPPLHHAPDLHTAHEQYYDYYDYY